MIVARRVAALLARAIRQPRSVALLQEIRLQELELAMGLMPRSGRVLEIGAGLGRTAFFAHQFGVPEYTIVDLPMTGSAQGYFLGRTLGADNVSLGGENSTGSVHILPSTDLEALEGRFDLIANIDSFTEMDRETATNYWKFAKAQTNLLYSINHEANHFTVRDIYTEQGDLDVVRTPYWLRKGYVEEIVRFP